MCVCALQLSLLSLRCVRRCCRHCCCTCCSASIGLILACELVLIGVQSHPPNRRSRTLPYVPCSRSECGVSALRGVAGTVMLKQRARDASPPYQTKSHTNASSARQNTNTCCDGCMLCACMLASLHALCSALFAALLLASNRYAHHFLSD